MPQNNDWSERVKKKKMSRGRADKSKSIWSWIISNTIQYEMRFEANRNDCGRPRMLNTAEIVFWDYCSCLCCKISSVAKLVLTKADIQCVDMLILQHQLFDECMHSTVCSLVYRYWNSSSKWKPKAKAVSWDCISVALGRQVLCAFPEKTIAYRLTSSASDNINIQGLFSTQTAMSYSATQTHRINCWSTHSF